MHNADPLQLRFDEFELDEGNARLTRNGQPLTLAPKAFAVLCVLARQPGQLLTKTALLDAVWGHQHVSESVLKTIISELRAALADDARQPRYIETASRRGYRFIATPLPLSKRDARPDTHPVPASNIDGYTPRTPLAAMIGRQTALTRLRKAWSHAEAGRRQISWVVGEAGIGKTTLIDNFVAGLGSTVCTFGQCVEQHGAGEPYLPVLEALADLCRNDTTLPDMLRAVAPTWYLQLPWLSNEGGRESLRRELAGVGQDRMLREMGELIEQYTRQRPLLLVTEDLHWSDHATVRLIDHVARRRGPARFMWLASFRLAEVVAEDHPLKALRHELRLHQLCDEIALDPFSERELADYLDRRFPEAEVPEAFVRTLHARTDGLPLFVVNAIDDLASQGALRPEPAAVLADAPTASLQVPESLAGVIERQIARLAPEDRALLEAASVCGVEFRPGTVADAVERDTRWVAEHCDDLVRRQQWLGGPTISRAADGTPDARYAFRHALYRHVFYQRIGSLSRSELHGRIAASMERHRASGGAVTAAELAAHYEQSHALMPALRHFAAAAENALRHFAPREALDLTAHALELLAPCPAGGARDALELTLSAMRGVASAQRLGVSSLEAKRAFERAQALLEAFPQHPLRGLVLNGLGLVLMVRAEYAETHALGERLLVLAQNQGDRILSLCACNMLGHTATLQGRHHEAIERLEQGIADCETIGDEALQAAFVVDPAVTMYGAIAIPLLHVGRIDQAQASIETVLARAQRLGQPMSKMVASWFGALFEIRRGNLEQIAAHAAALRAIVDSAALAQGEGPSEWFRGWVEAHQGRARDGFRRIRAAHDHNTGLGMYSGGTEVLGYAAEALALAGDWTGAQAQLDEAMQLAQRLGERVYLTQLLVLQGHIALAQGRLDAARAAMQAALREARAQQAAWLELVALTALCELPDTDPADIAALDAARAGLGEGAGTAPVARSDELLGAGNRAPVV